MADTKTLSTDTLVDVSGLNKVYGTNKKRIDEIKDGTTPPEYAKKIGDDKDNHPSIGNAHNPVYVNNEGKISSIIGNESAVHDISLGNYNTQNIYLGGEDTQEGGFPQTITHSYGFESNSIKISSGNKSVTLRYDGNLGALVFDFGLVEESDNSDNN